MKKYLISIVFLLVSLLAFSQPTNFLVLNGTETINIPDSNQINTGTEENRTVEFWFKVDNNNTGARQMIYKEGGGTRGINFYVDGGKLYLGMWNDTSADGDVDTWHGTWFRKDVDSNTWYHVALVLENGDSDDGNSGDELKWYLDGVFQDEANGGVLHPHGNDIYLGSNKNDGVYPSNNSRWVSGSNSDIYEAATNGESPSLTPDIYYTGAIGLLKIWNSARSQADIQANKNTIYTSSDLNNASDYLVAFLNGDYFEYVDSGGNDQVTDGGAEGNDGDILPKDVPVDFVWDGNSNTSWANADNWLSGTVPESGDNILIEVENTNRSGASSNPIIPDGNYYYGIFEVSSASILDLSNVVIMSNTDEFTNNGTLNVGSSSAVEGVGVVNNSDVIVDGNFSSNSDLTNSLGTITYNSGSKGDVGGILDNSGTFTIKSDASGTASLITDGSITNTGTIDVERYIDEGTKWQLISSPMNVETSNVFYGHYLNSYDAANGDFNAEKSSSLALATGEGFVVKWKDEFAAGTNPIVYSVDKPTTGDVDVALISYTGGDAESNTHFHLPLGFNLVGNPYPSSLSMEDVWADNRDHASGNDIDATFYYYQESGGWQVYNASTNIPADDLNRYINLGQGFGVVLSGNNTSGGTLHIPNSARTHEVGNGFNKRSSVVTTSNYFELNSETNYESSKIYFRFNDNSTSAYDGLFDSYKINSFDNSPNSYFISSDDKRLAICEMPESESVDLGFNMAISGEVTFSLSNIKDFTEITLEDKQEGTFTDLLKSDYTFYYSDEDAETGRFTIHFNQGTLSEVEELTGLKIYANSTSVILNSNESLSNVELELYNISGQKVLSKHFETLKYKEINTGLNGVYILKLTSEEGVYTSKLILN